MKKKERKYLVINDQKMEIRNFPGVYTTIFGNRVATLDEKGRIVVTMNGDMIVRTKSGSSLFFDNE